jgi:hypothetical protein
MKIIETTAPVKIEELKKYFADKDTFYLIDYANSDLKGTKLLTYLSNLDIPSSHPFKRACSGSLIAAFISKSCSETHM